MIQCKHSLSCYGDVGLFVKEVTPDIDRISSVLTRSRYDHYNDCKQTLFVHAIESYNDSTYTLQYQQLVNKMWWRAIDFVKRDGGFNFWRLHVPFSDDLSTMSIHPRFIGKYIQNPGAEAKVDIERIIDYASRICNERDFVVFILHLEGLSFAEISKIIYPSTECSAKDVRRTKSALWRIRNKLKKVMEWQ